MCLTKQKCNYQLHNLLFRGIQLFYLFVWFLFSDIQSVPLCFKYISNSSLLSPGSKMGSFFRSEEMCLVQLFFQTESAHYCINELGDLGLVQFKDLNPGSVAFQKRFVNEVKKCEEMERILRFLEKEILKTNITISEGCENVKAPCPRDVLELEATFQKLEQELKEINSNHEALKQNFTEMMEMKYLLQMTETTILLIIAIQNNGCGCILSLRLYTKSPIHLFSQLIQSFFFKPYCRFVAGVIKQERFPAFEKVLWRMFHGNFVLRHAEIQAPSEDFVSEELVKKDIFIVFLQGEQFKGKTRKICEGFQASLYPCPDTVHARMEMRTSVNLRIEDLQMVLRQTDEYRESILTSTAASLHEWNTKVKKMKAIYYTLNLCNLDITQKLIIAEIWCPVSDLSKVKAALIKGLPLPFQEQSGSSLCPVLNRLETQQIPPTFNRTNSFTSGFQNIIDAYGVGNYQEMNPAPYTIITFPFLFAVMFGDCGHGLIMTLFATWMVTQEEQFKKFKNEISDILFNGRYIILLMGILSIYTGFIYNDCFSKAFNIFGSSWRVKPIRIHVFFFSSNQTLHGSGILQLDPATPGVFSGSPYPFGIDPIWNIASNKLTFLNSYKMKMSVILGVIHMLFGVSLSLMNYTYFKNTRNIFLQFIPEVVFMLSLFGYLIFLIIFKWCSVLEPETAPSILLLFINMVLFTYSDSSDNMLYNGQRGVQIFLVITAILMVPWMLLIKPLLLYREQKIIKQQVGEQIPQQSFPFTCKMSPRINMSNTNISTHSITRVYYHFLKEARVLASTTCLSGFLLLQVSMGDVFVYQATHTIEYCLGCISNTASYLRLWALSLAHAELSEVLWKMVLQVGLTVGSRLGCLVVAAIFAIFAVLTVAVLLVMEGLSAFLHALRLHW
ncbi:VPP1 ATPase, partial [Atractosteus spatula]|nr:VPP1 ATPase [Atractosteus spatula]